MTVMELQFMAVAISINSVFKAINKSLREMLMKIHHEYIRTMQRVNVAHKIRQINHSFVSTSEALRNMNKSEGFILLLHLTVFSLDLAVTVNNILHSRHVNGNVSNTHLLVGHMMCYVSSETDPLRDEVDDFSNQLRLNDVSYSAMGVCHIGRPLISTVSNVRFLVGRIMCYVTSETDPVRDEIDDFYKQLLLNNTSFSAMGICNIGRPLISAVND
ncbi:uncharacterized protein LOC125072115 [Vanessa atalanta]|uniref:uncharacterized protein LOC125072115 n=1 Tax=Vanessa atalanta TaxID=42275 RepID=UPI001FCD054E|nr:uncharacterized protein LOC125072115 [Vanessa atalanta]